MVSNKSLDDSYNIIAALLRDIHSQKFVRQDGTFSENADWTEIANQTNGDAHGAVFNTRSLNLTLKKVWNRLQAEGMGFLTKALPRLGKAFDKAISGGASLNSTELGFISLPGGHLPRFLGEFFRNVLRQDGVLLQHPCAECVEVIRQICYLFYKYEMPYTDQQEQMVLAQFEKTEQDIATHWDHLDKAKALSRCSQCNYYVSGFASSEARLQYGIILKAQNLLKRLFANFDPKDIYPRHGPGAVATKQRLWDKFRWTNVSRRITDLYPYDAYFCASMGHVCDLYGKFSLVTEEDLPARVILVPKDSRGPRLISCEPVDFQWVQQGLGRGIVELVESHPITRWNVNFTDQSPNRCAALYGSSNGLYSTLDLNEASDRVTLDLVHLLFPKDVYTSIEAARSRSTVLPSGKKLELRKFAPMGSSLCFPILALTTWVLLSAAAPDAYTRERILVYGDDVIVPTAYAENAMKTLESFGLKINHDKSCTAGLFRESCGMDAFKGKDVTPVRLRTVWSSNRRADVYSSYIAYANRMWDRRYYRTYNYLVGRLHHTYGAIPDESMHIACPRLRQVTEQLKPKARRWNPDLQKSEYKVWDVRSPSITKVLDGWLMLLRYFSESVGQANAVPEGITALDNGSLQSRRPFSVSQYTSRKTSMLVKRWR